MFEYFYDNGKKRDTEWLVLSHDPQARVRMVFYDFDSLSFLAQEVSTGRLTGAQLFAGRRLAMTLPRGMADLGDHGGGRSFASGRIYGEMQLALDEAGATAAEGQNMGSRPFTINRMIPGRADVPEVVASAPVIYDIKTYLEPFEEPAEGASVLAVGIVFVVLLVVGILYTFKVYNLYAVFCPGCSSGAKLKKH
jgi:hypothetical protein